MKNFWYSARGAVSGYLRTVDRWLLLFWISASAASIMFLLGIAEKWPEYSGQFKMQIIASALGLFTAVVISLFDYHTLLKLWKLYVPLAVALMVLTYFFGTAVGDANQNWLYIPIGGGREVSVQPSEFLKISFITTFAMHLAKTREHLNDPRNVLLLLLHGDAHVAMLYEDMGNALVFVGIFAVMLFCAGLNWRYVFAAIPVAAIGLVVLWQRILSEDQKIRILVAYNPSLSERYAFQQKYGLIAMAMGGVRGTGLFSDSHIRVPMLYNDMIFTFIGEAGGFIGCLGVLFLLMAISLKILYNSNHALDDTGRFICVGVFAMIISQTFINLGMCLRLMPVIGVTLPLLSSGGTSVLSLYLGLGLVLSVYCHSSTGLFYLRKAN